MRKRPVWQTASSKLHFNPLVELGSKEQNPDSGYTAESGWVSLFLGKV